MKDLTFLGFARLGCKNQCFENESDRLVRPIGPSTDHKTNPIQCKKPIVNEPGENRLNW